MTALRNRELTARETAKMSEVNIANAFARTISRGLDQEGLKPRVALRKPRMTSRTQKANVGVL